MLVTSTDVNDCGESKEIGFDIIWDLAKATKQGVTITKSIKVISVIKL